MADTCDKDTVETRIEEDRRFARRLRRSGFLALIVTATGVAIYAGVGRAGPQYRSGSGSRSEIVRSSVRNGPLTLFITSSSGYGASRIETVDPGKSKTIWHCPHNNFCGQPVSFAWASDGRRVAFTLDEIGGTSPYPDLHVVDSSRSEMRRFRGLRSGAFRRPKSTGRRTERVSRTAAVGSTC